MMHRAGVPFHPPGCPVTSGTTTPTPRRGTVRTGTTCLLAVLLASVLAAAGCAYRTTDLAPAIPPNARSSTIYAADGTPIRTLFGTENRIEVPLDRIPEVVRHAVIAIEDERFYLHNGVDLRAIGRALRADALAGSAAQGASTITQQLIKITLLSSGKTVERKLEEVSLAWQLERHHSKEEILQIYLNTVYLGHGAYGVEAAARRYFGVGIDEVDAAQAATLAAIINAPSHYDPITQTERVLARRNLVLNKMAEQGYLDPPEAAAAIATGLELASAKVEDRYQAPHFVDAVMEFVLSDPRFGVTYEERANLLYTGGLRIHTTIDLEAQAQAEAAIAAVLPDDSYPEGGLVAIEPSTGHVKAMVGGRDYFADTPAAKVNLAMGNGRGSGSAFKPFVLAEALEQGMSLAERIPAPGCVEIPVGTEIWKPCNADPGSGNAEGLSLSEGTVHSSNTLYAELIMRVGPQKAITRASVLGVNPPTPLEPYPSAVLGSNDVRVLDMASAYATFANRGVYVPPTMVTKVSTVDGTVLYEAEHTQHKAITTSTSDAVTAVLTQVIERGTGTSAAIGRPAAGKTGTGEDYKNSWFVGYTPDLATAVWIGFPTAEIEMQPPATPIRVYGGTWPASIWKRFMAAAHDGLPVRAFPPPPPIPPAEETDDEDPEDLDDETDPSAPTTTTTILGQPVDPRDPDAPPTTRRPGATSPTAPTVPDRPRGTSVPYVVGMSQSQATRIVANAGLVPSVTIVAQGPSGARSGRVWRQEPGSGTEVAPGSTVSLYVNP